MVVVDLPYLDAVKMEGEIQKFESPKSHKR